MFNFNVSLSRCPLLILRWRGSEILFCLKGDGILSGRKQPNTNSRCIKYHALIPHRSAQSSQDWFSTAKLKHSEETFEHCFDQILTTVSFYAEHLKLFFLQMKRRYKIGIYKCTYGTHEPPPPPKKMVMADKGITRPLPCPSQESNLFFCAAQSTKLSANVILAGQLPKTSPKAFSA